MNAGERPAEDRRNALYMRAQQNSAAARLTVHFGVAAGLTAVFDSIRTDSKSWQYYDGNSILKFIEDFRQR